MTVRLHLLSDLVLAAVFVSLATSLAYLAVRSRRLPSSWAYAVGGMFAAACAALHLSEVLGNWSLESSSTAAFKLVSAVSGIATAALLLKAVPQAVGIAVARDALQHDLESQQQDVAALAHEVISKRRELAASAKALVLARREAERASRIKSDFLSLVSHELRTPLMRLQLQLDRLKREPDVAVGDVAQKLREAGRRLGSLVENMLEFADLQSGLSSPRFERVDVTAIVARVVEEVAPAARDKRLDLRLEPGLDLPEIVTDGQLLGLVVRHIVSNAVEHTARGAVTVSLDARNREAVCIAVSDSGPGISPALAQAVFEPFVVSEPIASKHRPGLGLGLAIARRALVALGGRLELETKLDVGSTFTVVIPCEPGMALEGTSADARACLHRGRRKAG